MGETSFSFWVSMARPNEPLTPGRSAWVYPRTDHQRDVLNCLANHLPRARIPALLILALTKAAESR